MRTGNASDRGRTRHARCAIDGASRRIAIAPVNRCRKTFAGSGVDIVKASVCEICDLKRKRLAAQNSIRIAVWNNDRIGIFYDC